MANLLSFIEKNKMAAAAILKCYFVTLDHPRSLLHGPNIVLKFYFNRSTTIRDMAVWKFCKFGLKRLFPPPIFAFLGGFDPKHYFSSPRPPKGTSLGESASSKVYIVKIRPPVFAVGDHKKKKERGGKERYTKSQVCFVIPHLEMRACDWSKSRQVGVNKSR